MHNDPDPDKDFKELVYGRCGRHMGVWRSLPSHVELVGDAQAQALLDDIDDEPGSLFDPRPGTRHRSPPRP